MGKMNWGRLILGGIVAGVIIDVSEGLLNGVILMKDWAEAMKALGKAEAGPMQLVGFNVYGLLLGLSAIWLYAAIRPRYGAGPKTAVCAGLAMWFIAYALGSGAGMIMEIFPMRLMAIGILWGLFEIVIATLAGAWFYKEEPASAF